MREIERVADDSSSIETRASALPSSLERPPHAVASSCGGPDGLRNAFASRCCSQTRQARYTRYVRRRLGADAPLLKRCSTPSTRSSVGVQ